jgi:hypothetical protein
MGRVAAAWRELFIRLQLSCSCHRSKAAQQFLYVPWLNQSLFVDAVHQAPGAVSQRDEFFAGQ